MRHRRAFSQPAVGGSALLVIFAVLCLTVFAMLALATVQADRRTADAAAAAVSDYYAADCAAERILAQLRRGSVPDGVAADGDLYTYEVPISTTQTLQVRVRVEGDVWTVLQWRASASGDWKPDAGGSVWDGEPNQ
jgi:hypothetical protein